MSKKARWMLLMLAAALAIIFVPLGVLPDAEFGGSDDAGSEMVEQVTGEAYEPWFTPVLEQFLGGELPGEVESLMFCIQTGIGVGVISFGFGYLVARKKYGGAKCSRQGGDLPAGNTAIPSKEEPL